MCETIDGTEKENDLEDEETNFLADKKDSEMFLKQGQETFWRKKQIE